MYCLFTIIYDYRLVWCDHHTILDMLLRLTTHRVHVVCVISWQRPTTFPASLQPYGVEITPKSMGIVMSPNSNTAITPYILQLYHCISRETPRKRNQQRTTHSMLTENLPFPPASLPRGFTCYCCLNVPHVDHHEAPGGVSLAATFYTVNKPPIPTKTIHFTIMPFH